MAILIISIKVFVVNKIELEYLFVHVLRIPGLPLH